MTRYIRELRVTIHDMYGNYKNTPNYELAPYNPTDRALGINLYGKQNDGFFSPRLDCYSFIRRLEERGWCVLNCDPRAKLIGSNDLQMAVPFLFIEVRKIEEIDIEPDTSIVSCDLCDKPRCYTHISGLEVCQKHYHDMVKKQPDCSCQEVGHDCCERHSEEPPNIDEGIVKTKLVKKQAD